VFICGFSFSALSALSAVSIKKTPRPRGEGLLAVPPVVESAGALPSHFADSGASPGGHTCGFAFRRQLTGGFPSVLGGGGSQSAASLP
jgi:hypothetical protein